eukprot:scaffold19557_cov76-Cyclotella_meneghiniana.AAC.1
MGGSEDEVVVEERDLDGVVLTVVGVLKESALFHTVEASDEFGRMLLHEIMLAARARPKGRLQERSSGVMVVVKDLGCVMCDVLVLGTGH